MVMALRGNSNPDFEFVNRPVLFVITGTWMKKPPESGSDEQRWRALWRLQKRLEIPMMVLGIAWVALLVLELYIGPAPLLVTLSAAIWILFAADFLIEITLAPSRTRYLRTNVLTVLSLLAPAFRVLRAARLLRAARAARLTRGISLVRIIGSANRSMSILRKLLARWGFGYVIALSAVVVLLGAAGMYALERGSPGFRTFGESLWWSAMILTTMGTQYWPETAEGRLLCFLLALYSFTVFGYVTAFLATFLIGPGRNGQETQELKDETRKLREEVRRPEREKGRD